MTTDLKSTINSDFKKLQETLKVQFKRTPGIEAILFLIGVNELGKGNIEYPRDEKMNLMHVAHCTIFALSGYYEKESVDEDGWPHFKVLKQYPNMELQEQEAFLKEHIVKYFRHIQYEF